MPTTLADYVGHTFTGRALCTTGGSRHVHEPITVKAIAATTEYLTVESEQELCSQAPGLADTAEVMPIFSNDDGDDFDYLAFGETPFHGYDESGEIELELDFSE